MRRHHSGRYSYHIGVVGQMTEPFKRTHGHTSNGGRERSPTYNSFRSMKDRCYRAPDEYTGEGGHPHYHRYGGRGITVCDRWRNGEDGKSGFACFLEDVGERPGLEFTLDRKEGDKGYYKENCKWSDLVEQTRNRSNAKLVRYRGADMTVHQAYLTSGSRVPFGAVTYRLQRGMELDSALTIPVKSRLKVKSHGRTKSKSTHLRRTSGTTSGPC